MVSDNDRVRLVQDPDTGEQRWKVVEQAAPVEVHGPRYGEQRTDDMFDPEWDLIGLVCDQIDRANPDLPIETCQAIARDIIALVREYS